MRSAVAAVLTSAALLFAAVGCERDYAEERDRLRPRPGTVTDEGAAAEADDHDDVDGERPSTTNDRGDVR